MGAVGSGCVGGHPHPRLSRESGNPPTPAPSWIPDQVRNDGFLRQAQDERGLTLTPVSSTGQAPTISHEGEGVLRQAQDERGRWAQDAWGATLTTVFPAKAGIHSLLPHVGFRIKSGMTGSFDGLRTNRRSPSPQPSPIEGEGVLRQAQDERGRGDQAWEGSPAPVSERNHGISAASSGHRNSNPASSAYFLSRSSRSPMW